MLPLVSPPNVSSASDWLNQNFPPDSTNQKHYPDLGSDASSVWNFCARFSDVIWRETSGSVAKCRLFSQATSPPKQAICEFKVQNFYQVRISFLRISRRITFMRMTYFPHFLLKNDAKGNSKIVYFVHVYALLTKAGWGQDAWIWAKFLLAFFWTQTNAQ